MNWIDAIVEMKKDNGKVFESVYSLYKFQIKDNKLLQKSPQTNSEWELSTIQIGEQEKLWVEVKQFKEVDYAEFMEWYCNPNNKGKLCNISYRTGSSSVSCNLYNNMQQSPYWFSTECVRFQIPNE